MNEETLNTLRQQDTNLREALRLEETERPQMPADLNARLMQRMAQEEKKPRRVIWPWIAAACVAGMMIIWLTPPKDTASPTAPLQETEGVVAQEVPTTEEPKVEASREADVTKEPSPCYKTQKRPQRAVTTDHILAQQLAVPSAQTDANEDDLMATADPKAETKMTTLTERDIPITRPENYHYTPEELALMKKQANEAYLKWMELELEIAKHNLEQTAQTDF